MVNHEISAEILYEDENLIAIKDINPAAPVHMLIIPRKHIASLNDVGREDIELLGQIQLLSSHLANKAGIAGQGYRLVNNCGEWGGQIIFHLHYHLLGGREMGWPPE